MQDNAPSHASMMTKDFLSSIGFSGSRLMAWPASSPDLNPIENYWAVFKSKLYTQNKQYSNKNDLWEGIVRTFSQMNKGLVKKLTRSMDGRLVEVLKKNGSYIRH